MRVAYYIMTFDKRKIQCLVQDGNPDFSSITLRYKIYCMKKTNQSKVNKNAIQTGETSSAT